MKRKLTALLAALCITAVLPVHAGAVICKFNSG